MDINAIKSRLSTLQATSNTKDNFWKPEPGKQVVRIVPYKFNKDNPFIELFFHYSLGNNKTYMSPFSFGRPDPVAEFADKLKSTGNKDEWIQGKRLEPKMRTFAPVIVRGKESEGVKFWGFGKTVYQELLSVIADPDYGDITDPVNGRDISVEFLTAEETGASYPKTNIRVKPNQTAITEDAQKLESLLENQSDLREIYTELSYDELTDVLNQWLQGTEEEEAEEKKSPALDTATSNVNVEDAFDDLFNK